MSIIKRFIDQNGGKIPQNPEENDYLYEVRRMEEEHRHRQWLELKSNFIKSIKYGNKESNNDSGDTGKQG